MDQWLWYARFFKTRSLAIKQVQAGHVRVGGTRISKPAQAVRAGDVLTFPQGRRIRVVRIEATALRRGPASEAQTLYTDLTPPEEEDAPSAARVGARPTKKDRRTLDQTRRGPLE